MKIDDRFSPGLAQLAKPSSSNALTILGGGLLAFDKSQKESALHDIRLQDIQDARHDDKQLAAFASSGKSLRQWQEDGGVFKTSKGALAAQNLLRQRAADRLKERGFELKAQRLALLNKATRQKAQKREETPSFNPDAFYTKEERQESHAPTTTTPSVETKTVTVYKDGKPIVYTIEG